MSVSFKILALAAAAVSLTACASTGDGGPNSYGARLEKLSTDCQARGGILTASGAQTGRPETDNVCRITGGATRIESH